MKNSNPLEDILNNLPDMAKTLKTEADNIGRTVLQSQLQKADVVSREAFEEQRELLKLALEKLARLEAKLEALEKRSATEHEKD